MQNTPTVRVRRQLLIGFCLFALTAFARAAHVDRHQTGTHYSPLKQINTTNVARLRHAWTFNTGEAPQGKVENKLIAFEDQPSLIEGNLIVCTRLRRVIALDPRTGKQRWVFDPKDPPIGTQKCRGIAHWVDREAPENAVCKSRIFLGTTSYRLLAIDAKTGKPCKGFGNQGQVQMQPSKPEIMVGEVIATSKPAIVNDGVVVGSAVADNRRVAAPSGRVLAFDARTGKALWEFDPVPRDPNDPAMKTWGKGTANFGQGNVWANMAVDQALDRLPANHEPIGRFLWRRSSWR